MTSDLIHLLFPLCLSICVWQHQLVGEVQIEPMPTLTSAMWPIKPFSSPPHSHPFVFIGPQGTPYCLFHLFFHFISLTVIVLLFSFVFKMSSSTELWLDTAPLRPGGVPEALRFVLIPHVLMARLVGHGASSFFSHSHPLPIATGRL